MGGMNGSVGPSTILFLFYVDILARAVIEAWLVCGHCDWDGGYEEGLPLGSLLVHPFLNGVANCFRLLLFAGLRGRHERALEQNQNGV